MKRQEVIDYIDEEFGVCPEQLWASFPNYLVFRNAKNKKWFGIMMDIESEKLGLGGSGKKDILVIKSDPILIGSLIHNKGYLPAYHMSKKNWVTVLLDGSAPDEQVKDLIHLSYEIIEKAKR